MDCRLIEIFYVEKLIGNIEWTVCCGHSIERVNQSPHAYRSFGFISITSKVLNRNLQSSEQL